MTGAEQVRERLREAQHANRRHVRLTIREARDLIATLEAVAGIADRARQALARDEA